MKNYIALFAVSIKNSKNLKYHSKNEDEKLFKQEELIEIVKILGLIENI